MTADPLTLSLRFAAMGELYAVLWHKSTTIACHKYLFLYVVGKPCVVRVNVAHCNA